MMDNKTVKYIRDCMVKAETDLLNKGYSDIGIDLKRPNRNAITNKVVNMLIKRGFNARVIYNNNPQRKWVYAWVQARVSE